MLAGLVLILAAVAIVLATLDWNRFKPTINTRVSEAIGRPFAIDGDLDVDWRMPWEPGAEGVLPWAHVTAGGLSVGNPEWAQTPHFAALDRFAITLSPWALITKRVRASRVELERPSVNFEREEDGRNNWTFGAKDEGGESAWRFDVRELVFDEAHIGLDDATREAKLDLAVKALGEPIDVGELVGGQATSPRAAAERYAFGWEGKGSHGGAAVKGKGRLGSLVALNDPGRPFPVQADISVGETRIALEGTVTEPQALAALDLKLRLSGRSMAELYPLVGVTLPDTPPYRTDGRLVATLREPDGAVYRYEDFTGRVGESDLRGSVRYTAGEPRPKLSGTLSSRKLRFADLGPLIGVGGREEGGEQPPPGQVLPVQAFRTDRWTAMDADVKFAGERIERNEALPLTGVDTHLVLDAGVLRLDPLRLGMAGGVLAGTVRLDGRTAPLAGRVDLAARHFKLKEMFPTFEPMQSSLGELNADVKLAGNGNSVAALLGSADGQASLLIDRGTVSRDLMELVGLNVGRFVVNQFFGDEQVPINCVIADVRIDDGVVRPIVFLADTENAVVRVDGSVDLGSERLDLDVRAESKGARIVSFRSPLTVGGRLGSPDMGVKTGPLAARAAGMLALGAAAGPLAGLLALISPGTEEGNRCQPLVQRLQGEPEGGGR